MFLKCTEETTGSIVIIWGFQHINLEIGQSSAIQQRLIHPQMYGKVQSQPMKSVSNQIANKIRGLLSTYIHVDAFTKKTTTSAFGRSDR